MKVKVSKKDFEKTLSKLHNLADKKGTLPILSNIYMKAQENNLELMTTNLEVGAKCKLPSFVETSGEALCNVVKLFQIIKNLNASEIEIHSDDKVVTIKTPNSMFKLAQANKDEFPSFEPPEDFEAEIESHLLLNALKKVKAAISKEDLGGFTLSGVYFNINDNYLDVVATDTHRLHLYKIPLINKTKEGNILIPKKSANELMKILKDTKLCKLSFLNGKLFVEADDTLFFTISLEGNFPNYTRPFELFENPTLSVTVSRDDFLKALKELSAIYANVKLDVKPITLEIKEDNLILSAQYEGEEGSITLPCKVEGYLDENIVFNLSFLVDAFSSFDRSEINMKFLGEDKPLLIDSTLENLKVIIMPMKIS